MTTRETVTDLSHLRWWVRAQDQGQTIEVSYARDGGDAYRRVYDRSGGVGGEVVYRAQPSSWWTPDTGERDLHGPVQWVRLDRATAGPGTVA